MHWFIQPGRRLAVTGLAATGLVAACTLFTDLDGLSGESEARDAEPEATRSDAETGLDAATADAFPQSNPGKITCGTTDCDVDGSVCCHGGGGQRVCVSPSSCRMNISARFGCDEAADCPGKSCCLERFDDSLTECKSVFCAVRPCKSDSECGGTTCAQARCKEALGLFACGGRCPDGGDL